MKTLLVALLVCLTPISKAEPVYRYLALNLDIGHTKQLAALERVRIPELTLTAISFGRAISVLCPIHDDKEDFSIDAGIFDPDDKIASKIVTLKRTDVSISEAYDRLCVQVGAVWMFDGNMIKIIPAEKKTEPNQAVEPTTMRVTDPANAGSAPRMVAAHF